MKTLKIIAIVILPLTGMLQPSYAQEVVTENNLVAGVRALGMGGAQIAAVNDVTAVIHNPAALARINNLEVQMGLLMLKRNISTNLSSNFVNGSGRADNSYTGLGTIGLAYPVSTERGSLVFALAYNRVKDFSGIFNLNDYNDYAFETDDEVWGGYENFETTDQGGLGIFSIAGAVDISPNVSVGASFDVWSGSYNTDMRVLRNDYDGEVSWLDITGGEDNITAWSFKPSILYFNKNFRFGAFVRFPMTFHIDQRNYEEYYSRNDGYFFNIHSSINPTSGEDFLDDNYYSVADYKIKAPMQLGFGLSMGNPRTGSLAIDLVYENWEEAKFDDEYDPHYFRDKYRSATNWRIGYERSLPFLKTVGRIGYLRQPVTFRGPRGNSFEEPYIDVVNERDYITLGFSKEFDESFVLDVGYAHGFWSQEEGNRKDKESHDRIYASVKYRLPAVFK